VSVRPHAATAWNLDLMTDDWTDVVRPVVSDGEREP